MKKRMQKKPRAFQPFLTGQVWRFNDCTVRIGLVGKTLVHYKYYREDAKRPPVLLSSKRVLERFLQRQDAVLQQEPLPVELKPGGRQIQFGRTCFRTAQE